MQLRPPKTCAGGGGVQGEVSEAFLPHFMSPASPLFGAKEGSRRPLKGEAPSPPLPTPLDTAASGWGQGLEGLGWASVVTASAHPGCAFDFKIKVHLVLCVSSVCVRRVCRAEGLGQILSRGGLGPQRGGAGQTLLGKTMPFVLDF